MKTRLFIASDHINFFSYTVRIFLNSDLSRTKLYLYTLLMLLDFLFPKTCLCCNRLGTYVCLACEKGLKRISLDRCLCCNKVTIYGETHAGCRNTCAIDGVSSLVEYQKEARQVIKKLKYRLLRDAFQELFKILAPIMISKLARFKRLYPDAVLQPIPLHSTRMKMRGFNQSEVYARYLSGLLKLPLVDVISRGRKTLPQATMSTRQAREENIKNAFVADPKAEIKGKIYILVDDVITTGYTAQEAAKLLKTAGALQVYVFTLARGT